MIQIYFLSILCNSLTAYILILDDTGEGASIADSVQFSFRKGIFPLVLGILCALTGVLKLLSPSQDSLPILGDLVPALAGLLAGFVLIFSYYREHASIGASASGGTLDRMGDAFLKYKKGLGFILLASAALHFLFPQALFL